MTNPILKGIVLAVDDAPENLRLLAEILNTAGYRMLLFPDGTSALQALETILPDIILLDINMPGMNGYEVCRRMKTNPKARDIPVLFVSASNSTEDKVKAFTLGGVDYITKPFNAEEVLARIEIHTKLRKLQHELQSQLQEHQMELQWAGEMQKAMMHPDVTGSDWVEFQYSWLPLEGMYCSGDYLDIVRLSPDRYLILLGDVAGHGVKAAFITGILKAIIYPEYIRKTIGKEFSPASFLNWLNQRMNFELRKTQGMIISFFAGVLDRTKSLLTYANAGQNFPLLIHAGTISSLSVSGPAMGLMDAPNYPQESVSIAANDLFLVYTDGLVESGGTKPENRLLSLMKILENLPYGDEYPQRLQQQVGFTTLKRFEDDVTIVSARIRRVV